MNSVNSDGYALSFNENGLLIIDAETALLADNLYKSLNKGKAKFLIAPAKRQ